MSLRVLSVRSLRIPFKQSFAHASAVRSVTESVLVRVVDGEGREGVGEGCPRRYVTGETVESIQQFIEAYRGEWVEFSGLDDLTRWVVDHAAIVDRNPAGWCAVEIACLDLFGRRAAMPIERLIGVPTLRGPFRYSAVLGTETMAAFDKQFAQYLAAGFLDFKVKVTGRVQEDIDKLSKLAALPNCRVRLDANNHWIRAEDAIASLRQLPRPISAIEEPLSVGDLEGCRQVAEALGVRIVLDESLLRADQCDALARDPARWMVNIRVSKMGGLVRSLAVAERAKQRGIPIVVGAQVGETSILTRAALPVAQAYRDVVMAQEGAFGTHLLEHDICQPTVMFGNGGVLLPDALSTRPGLGLTVRD